MIASVRLTVKAASAADGTGYSMTSFRVDEPRSESSLSR